jgi:hypothetical protein
MDGVNGTCVANGINSPAALTNYIAHEEPQRNSQPRIGHLSFKDSTIQPLSFTSGTPITTSTL